jgi:K+-transporting ATPase KdpF subunit
VIGSEERPSMLFDYILGGAFTLAIFAYLLYVLIRTERF